MKNKKESGLHNKKRMLFARHKRKYALLVSIAALVGNSSCVIAETRKAASGFLEEVIITAQKREESAQDVGIAITSFTGDQLRKLGVVSSIDIAAYTPGVSISGAFAGQQTQYSIRGVTQNDFSDHVESPNAVYIDEGYVSFQQGSVFATFDVDRVEVLKGPQGTLFGRNATGGLVHFITNQPSREFEGYLDAGFSEYDTSRIEAAVSGPINDALSYRIAVLYSDRGNYVDNDFPETTHVPVAQESDLSLGPWPEGVGADMGADETWAFRAKLAYDINEESQLAASVFNSRTTQATGPYQDLPAIVQVDDQGRALNSFRAGSTETRRVISPGGLTDGTRPVPGGDYFGYIDPDGIGFRTSVDFAFDDSQRYHTAGTTVKYTTTIGELAFTSISDYKRHEKVALLDVEGSPASQLIWNNQADFDTYTQEFRLAGETDALYWVAGAYYLNIDAFSVNGVSWFENGIFGGGATEFPRISDLQTESSSVFAQLEYSLSDSLKLIGGARGTRESKDILHDVRSGPNVNVLGWDDGPLAGPSIRNEGTFTDSTSENLVTLKLQLDWQLDEDMLLYASYNRGAKAGSFNSGDFDQTNASTPYDSEVLHAYELGLKSEWADSRVRINGAIYYYDYQDYQAARWLGLANLITNNDATVKGMELELIASPIESLDVMVSLALIDATVHDIDILGDGTLLNESRPTFSPETTASLFVRYTIPDMLQGDLAFQFSTTYQSDTFHNLSNFDSTKLPSWTTTDIRASWENSDRNLSIDLFVQNVFDERYSTIGFDLAALCGCNIESQGLPRWAGISARYSF